MWEGCYSYRSVLRGRNGFRGWMKIKDLNWVVLGVNCLNQDLQDYSKTRNYLYTKRWARIQSSPAGVGCLFLDEL